MTTVLEETTMQVVVAHNAAQLDAHIAAWDDLAANAIEPNVFYESWHLRPALRAVGKGAFRFVFIYANRPNQTPLLCGFFPLTMRRRYKGIAARTLALWKHDYSSLCTPLVRAEHENNCLEAFLDWLSDKSGAALLEMESVSADGPFHRYWIDVLHERATLGFTDEIYTRALLQPSSGNADDYLHSALSRKRRKELKRLENRLNELGQLKYEIVEDAPQGIEEFLQLEAAGWKGRAGTAFANQETHQAFFRDVANEAAARGRLMLLALRLDGRAIAMKFNLTASNGSFACKIAFDEDYARFSPGVLLEIDNIRRVIENSDLCWMDSCAIPDHSMINRLWTERRVIQNSLLSSGNLSGDLVVSLLPLLHLVRRRLKKRTSGATIEKEKI